MTSTPLLDWRPESKARASDPETSHAAARQSRGLAGEHHRRILRALQHVLEDGTAEDLARVTGMETHQVNRRTGELLSAGLIELTGEARKNSAGRMMRVFRRKASDG